jgi:hypothetical protein
VNLQLFAGLLTAAVTGAFSAMALGRPRSIWDRHAIAGFFQRHRIGKARRPGAVTTVLQLPPARRHEKDRLAGTNTKDHCKSATDTPTLGCQ